MADFATVADLETYMGVPNLGARGTAMLGYASAAIRGYLHQDIEAAAGRSESWAGDAWRDVITLTQRPVNAVTSVTVDGVALADFLWTRWGQVWRTDGLAWSTGPIVITYDSGYDPASDEMAQVKAITLEVAARALGGNAETFGLEDFEVRGPTPAVFLTERNMHDLDGLGTVAVA